jgi:hypothetical protein
MLMATALLTLTEAQNWERLLPMASTKKQPFEACDPVKLAAVFRRSYILSKILIQ